MKKLLILVAICMAYTITFAQPLQDRWSITPSKTTNASGRLWMDFPMNTNWVIYVYRQSDNKYITSYAPKTKVASIALPDGEYRITLNNALLENVQIKKGYDTKLNIGILEVNHTEVWYVYDETGQVYLSSGTKPDKLLLPVGTYTLEAGNVKQKISVKPLNYESHPSIETDQWSITYEGGSGSTNNSTSAKGMFTVTLPGHPGYSLLSNDTSIHCSYVTCPGPFSLNEGNYTMLLYRVSPSAVLLKDVPIKANYKTRVKLGYMAVDLLSDWALYDESKQKKLAWGNKPRIITSYAGVYHIFYKEKFQAVKIPDADTVLVDALNFDNLIKDSLFDFILFKGSKSDQGRLRTKFAEDPRRMFYIGNTHIPAVPDSIHYLPPGTYQIKLNGLDVKNVPIKKGFETKIKAGYLQLGDQVRWYLYDINKKTILKQGQSGTGSLNGVPFKLAILQGVYYLFIADSETESPIKGHRIIIKDGETITFY